MVFYLVFVFVISVIYLLYYLLTKNRNYWRDRNVCYLKPLPLFGNYKEYLMLRKHINIVMQEICQQFPNEPYIGSFYGTEPALIIQEPSLLKLVMSKDFYYCNGREASDHNDKEMLAKHMFLSTGDEWKVLRTHSTPLFSSVKLKNMFYLIKDYSDTLESLLEQEVKTNGNIDVRSTLSRFTIDCITACAFGLSAETMKGDVRKNPFSITGKKIFELTDFKAFKIICRSIWPTLFYALGFKIFEDDIGMFFKNIISGVFKNREETKTLKHDFVDLILTWKKEKHITGDSMSNIKTGDKKIVKIKVDDNLLLAQCFLFFAAGFETTSTTISYLLYELAKHKEVQNKVIEEVDKYFVENATIEYECLFSMPYLESCIEESLRLYPVLGMLTREVMHDYSLPTGLRFKKGDRIHIPVHHIHRNPNFFPEPDEFRPDRFFGEQKKNIKQYSYLPFGEGPRICIGMRFAKMPIYAALLKIFKNYRIELADNMPEKLTLNPKSLISQPIGGIHIKFISRAA